MHEQPVGRAGRLGDRREVLLGIVGRLGIEGGIDGEARGHEQDGVAVGGALAAAPMPRLPPAPVMFSM